MLMPGLSPQLTAPRPETAEAAALKLARASLEALALKVGQVLDAKVLGTSPNGLTQLSIAGQLLNLKLSLPLPMGTQLQIQVQAGGPPGPPVLVVQTPQQGAPPPPLPTIAPPLPLPQPTGGSAAPALTPMPPIQPLPRPPVATATVPLPSLPAGTPQPPAPAARPTLVPAAMPAAPGPGPAAISTPQVTAPAAPVVPVTQAFAAAPVPAAPTTAATSPVQATPLQPRAVATPTAPVATTAPAPASAPISAPVSSVAPPLPLPAGPLRVPAAAAPAPATPFVQHAPAVVPSAAPPGANPASIPTTANSPAPAPTVQHLPPPAMPIRAVLLSPPLAPPPAGSVAQAHLDQATQAAARQDSMAPLLQNLSALQGRIGELPRPVVAAALRLLGGRINLDRGALSGEGLQQAVLRSGIFLEALAKPALAQSPPQGDAKAALLQLRGALTAWLGEDVAPVPPVARRPQPPTRGAQPRGLRSEAPTLPEAAAPKQAGRSLLGQTEAALSRVRLLQLASLPQDAARAASLGPAAAAEWNLEIPLLLGHELAMAQLQISRDGKGKNERRERGWRMAFSLNFSALGEVGAQVSLIGRNASVLIWAEEDETATALAEMLPDLTPALMAKGLAVGSVRVRRGRPKAAQPQSGQLMDSSR